MLTGMKLRGRMKLLNRLDAKLHEHKRYRVMYRDSEMSGEVDRYWLKSSADHQARFINRTREDLQSRLPKGVTLPSTAMQAWVERV